MIRFDGNAILLVDSDKDFLGKLTEVLNSHGAKCFTAHNLEDAKTFFSKYECDLVISNYHLTDGIIHQLIDWCSKNMSQLPVFTCLGYPIVIDAHFIHKQSIAGNFSKSDISGIVSSLSSLLFDFNEFHQSLLEMISPEEVELSLSVFDKTYKVTPLEINEESIYLSLSTNFPKGSFGILKFSLSYEDQFHSFVIPGYLNGKCSDGMVFTINKNYIVNWGRFLEFLALKQVKISEFLNKAAGY